MSWQYLNKGRRSTPRTLPDLRLITGAESMSAFPDGSFPRGNPERQVVAPEVEQARPLQRIAAKRDVCLDDAIASGDDDGIRGGMTSAARRQHSKTLAAAERRAADSDGEGWAWGSSRKK